MIMSTEPVGVSGGGKAASPTFSFRAEDVTGTFTIDAHDVQRSAPAGAVASALARQLSLPESVAWTLRSETTGAFLDDNRAIGEQLEPGARTTLTPKSHLGADQPKHRR
jgi:hypothetical protein